MGRIRIIDRDAVLSAAERVVSRDGAARLTVEAVAAEAGISKASVLYDYKTKQGLIKAVVERRVAAECKRLREIIKKLEPAPDCAIQGCIAAVANRSLSDADREVALCLSAALAQDPDLRAPIQEKFRQQMAEILETSSRPRNALLAFLALEGLKLLECFGIYTWPDDDRRRLLEEISGLATGRPVAKTGRSAQD